MIRRPPRSTPLSLHDALPISTATRASRSAPSTFARRKPCSKESSLPCKTDSRSEEHTSELQSRLHLVCRLLLEKKKQIYKHAAVMLSPSHLAERPKLPHIGGR